MLIQGKCVYSSTFCSFFLFFLLMCKHGCWHKGTFRAFLFSSYLYRHSQGISVFQRWKETITTISSWNQPQIETISAAEKKKIRDRVFGRDSKSGPFASIKPHAVCSPSMAVWVTQTLLTSAVRLCWTCIEWHIYKTSYICSYSHESFQKGALWVICNWWI